MAGLRDIKRRIVSVESTQKITSAMKMVSAAKLRRAQDAIESARPYAERMKSTLEEVAGAGGDASLLGVSLSPSASPWACGTAAHWHAQIPG